jgi:protein ImuB
MFACLYLPDFPCQAALIAQYADAQGRSRYHPAAVLDGPKNLQRVFALNDAARKIGIKLGMTKLQVEACSEIWLFKRAAKHEASAHAQLFECADAFSPRVESTHPGTVLLDLSGTEKLFGSLENTAAKLLRDAESGGFVSHVAIASNPDTAQYAARGFSGITVVPIGEEALTLSRLSVALLPMAAEVLETLEGWGIHTFKALAGLPEGALITRLGQAGLHLQRLAQGRVIRPLLPVEPAQRFVETYKFDDPIETLESLTFVLDRLLQQLCTKLRVHSLATRELRLTLQLEVRQHNDAGNGEQYRHSWKLPFPAQDKNVLFNLIRLDLQKHTFSAPIKTVIIEALPIKPRFAQANLFAPPSPEAEKIEITLARIRGIVGSTDLNAISCVGTPKIADTHKPDSFTLEAFSTTNASVAELATMTPYTLRMFRPAMETTVKLSGATPHLVRLWSKHRRVIAASGPWCSSGDWWNKAMAWEREEWDVALKTQAGVGLYRIYFDRIYSRWFLEGMFD